MTIELNEEEAQTLKGILLVETNELNELVHQTEINEKDKKELTVELERVNSIIKKLN